MRPWIAPGASDVDGDFHPFDTLSALVEELGEDDGVVVLLIPSGVEDRQRTSCRPAAQVGKALGMSSKLAAVTSAELGKARRDVVEPLAQLIAWGQLLSPIVQVSALAGDAARPNMVDQDSVAVRRIDLFVDPLGTNVELGTAHCRPG